MNQDHFRYLDAVASDTEDAHVRARSGPVFYNVPGPTKLMAHFLIDRETAVAAFRAWKKARGTTRHLRALEVHLSSKP